MSEVDYKELAEQAGTNVTARLEVYRDALERAGHAHGYALGYKEGFEAARKHLLDLAHSMKPSNG